MCSKKSLRRNPAGGKFLATAVVRLDDVDVVKVLVLGILGVLGAWVTKPMTLRVHRADGISPLRAPKSHRDDLGVCGLLSIPFSSRGVCNLYKSSPPHKT